MPKLTDHVTCSPQCGEKECLCRLVRSTVRLRPYRRFATFGVGTVRRAGPCVKVHFEKTTVAGPFRRQNQSSWRAFSAPREAVCVYFPKLAVRCFRARAASLGACEKYKSIKKFRHERKRKTLRSARFFLRSARFFLRCARFFLRCARFSSRECHTPENTHLHPPHAPLALLTPHISDLHKHEDSRADTAKPLPSHR